MKKCILLACTLILGACTGSIDDLQVYVAEVKAKTPVSIEAYPEFNSPEAFKYSAAQLRSPFQHPRNSGIEVQTAATANCEQPNFSRSKQSLEKYGVDALSIMGVFTSNNKDWALIQTNTGSLHKATIGDYLGLFFGKITSINNGTISYTEMLPDGAGCWQKKQAKLTMSSKAGEKNV